MASKWITFPVNFAGGLMTSASPLSLGAEMPGSASRLVNMEFNSEGGFQKILGFQKAITTPVPPYGEPRLHETLSTTNYRIGGLSHAPIVGDTFYFEGHEGVTQTITAINWSPRAREATVVVSPGLASSPTVPYGRVTFTSEGVSTFNGVMVLTTGDLLVKRGGALYVADPTSPGNTWERVDKPHYEETPQATIATANTINITNIEQSPQVGDMFRFSSALSPYDGRIFRITTVFSYDSMAQSGSFRFVPALPTLVPTPIDIEFVGSGLFEGDARENKLIGTHYRFVGDSCRVVCVDRLNRPFTLDCATHHFRWLTNANEEVVGDWESGASTVALLNSSLFFGNKNLLTFTAPSTDNDFNPANGAGVINVGDQIVAIYPFRQSLIVFCKNRILALQGTSSADFRLSTLSERLGCLSRDSVKEIGGDVLYLAPDGVRFLSDTDRSGEFGLNIASRQIRQDMLQFTRNYGNDVQAVLIRNKSQYRIFGMKPTTPVELSVGYLATQGAQQGSVQLQWGLISGMKVYSADSMFSPTEEIVVFTNWDDNFVYRMEYTNRFGPTPISWLYRSHPIMLTDPTLRKTLHKVNLYGRLAETSVINLRIIRDFNDPGTIQSANIYPLTHDDAGAAWDAGTTIWDAFEWDGFVPRTLLSTQTTAHGFVFAIELYGEDEINPFIMDSMFLEFSQQDRQ